MARTKGAVDKKQRRERPDTAAKRAREAAAAVANAAVAAANLSALRAALHGRPQRGAPSSATNAANSTATTPMDTAGPSGTTHDDGDDALDSHAASPMDEDAVAGAEEAAPAAAAAADDEICQPVDRETIEEQILLDEGILHDVDDGETLDDAAPPSDINRELHAAVQKRLVEESAESVESPWLINHLRCNDWWIRAEYAPTVARKLGLTVNLLNKFYFRDLKVWLPCMQYSMKVPCTTCCGCDTKSKGWANVRTVVGMKTNYFVMSKRYECNACVPKFQAAKAVAKAALNAAGLSEDAANAKLKRSDIDAGKGSWSGADRACVERLPYNRGLGFPAFLTHRSGLDRDLVDLMRPLVVAGVRFERISRTVLEMQTKAHIRALVRREEEVKFRREQGSTSTFAGDESDKKLFSQY